MSDPYTEYYRENFKMAGEFINKHYSQESIKLEKIFFLSTIEEMIDDLLDDTK